MPSVCIKTGFQENDSVKIDREVMPVEIHFMLCFHLKHKVSGFKLPFVFCVRIFNGSGKVSAHGMVMFAHHVKRRLHKAAAVFQNVRKAVAGLKGFQRLSAPKFKVGVVQIFAMAA